MKNKVLKTIKKYNLIENGDKLVLGVSGGPDSIAMLNILNDLRIEKDIDKLQAMYDLGISDCKKCLEDLKEYIGE